MCAMSQIPSRERSEKYMFAWAALDESADKRQEHSYVVAGLLTAQPIWNDIERAWNRRLNREGMDYFKTSEFLGLRGQFERFRNKNKYPEPTGREAANEIREDLALILRSETVIGVVTALRLKDYKRVRTTARAKKILPRSHHQFMYQLAIVTIAAHVAGFSKPEVIAFLCDEHSKAPSILSSYAALKAYNPMSAEYMGSLTFDSDERWVALQAADLIAGACKEFTVKVLTGQAKNIEEERTKLRAFIGSGMGLTSINESMLRKLVEANYLHDGKPSIRSARQQKLFKDLFEIPGKPLP